MSQRIVRHSPVISLAHYTVYWLMAVQLVVVFLISSLWWIKVDSTSGAAAFLGGICCMLPNALFAFRFFGQGDLRPGVQILLRLVIEEIIKLALAVTLVLWSLFRLRLSVLPLLTGFSVTYLGYLILPLVLAIRYRVRGD